MLPHCELQLVGFPNILSICWVHSFLGDTWCHRRLAFILAQDGPTCLLLSQLPFPCCAMGSVQENFQKKGKIRSPHTHGSKCVKYFIHVRKLVYSNGFRTEWKKHRFIWTTEECWNVLRTKMQMNFRKGGAGGRYLESPLGGTDGLYLSMGSLEHTTWKGGLQTHIVF